MSATATVVRDSGSTTTRNVVVDFSDDDGFINRAHVRLSAGVIAQDWGDAVAPRRSASARRQEMESAIARCITGEDPATIPLVRIARPKLWQKMTRRLHNHATNGLSDEDKKGLAQWLVNRSTAAIVDDLPGRRAAEVNNTLKPEWQALLDASITTFDPIEEEEA